jgi:hypothetical protein
MHSLPNYLENLKQDLQKNGTKKTAWKIINEYFSFMGMDTIREELWILTKGTITNDLMEQSEKGIDRHNLLFGYEFLLLFFQAVDLLREKREIKKTGGEW